MTYYKNVEKKPDRGYFTNGHLYPLYKTTLGQLGVILRDNGSTQGANLTSSNKYWELIEIEE